MRGKTYWERLAEMEMTTLADRRRRRDLIQMFRAMKNQEPRGRHVNQGDLRLPECGRNQRKTNVRGKIWSGRFVNSCNSLPDSVKASPSVDDKRMA